MPTVKLTNLRVDRLAGVSGVLLVMLGAIGVTALARKWMPQPGLLVFVLAGAASFIPGMPTLSLPPHLIFSLVMPPLLYSAAIHFSFFAFTRNLRSIFALGVGMVVVTCVASAAVSMWLAPALGFAGAAMLGAVVSPPDTVTMVTRGRQIGLPRRVVAILTGECLINDAAALTIFAVVAARLTGEETFISNPVLFFVYGAFIGAFIGFALANITNLIRRRLGDHTLESVLGILLCFTAYFVADQVHASGVLAVVMAAFTIGAQTSFAAGADRPNKRYSGAGWATRVQERGLWPVIDALLEAFVFSYMGLQSRHLATELSAHPNATGRAIGLGLAVLLAVMATRIIWAGFTFGRFNLMLIWSRKVIIKGRQRVMRQIAAGGPQAQRLKHRFEAGERARQQRLEARIEARRRRHPRGNFDPQARLPQSVKERRRSFPKLMSWKEVALVSWTGMRGIVTLAVADEVPTFAAGAADDGRLLIQAVAFIVASGTLLIQGTTLPLLARRLNIDTSEEEAAEAAAIEQGKKALEMVPADDFPARRQAVLKAFFTNLDDEVAGRFLKQIDLAEAAAQEVR